MVAFRNELPTQWIYRQQFPKVHFLGGFSEDNCLAAIALLLDNNLRPLHNHRNAKFVVFDGRKWHYADETLARSLFETAAEVLLEKSRVTYQQLDEKIADQIDDKIKEVAQRIAKTGGMNRDQYPTIEELRGMAIEELLTVEEHTIRTAAIAYEQFITKTLLSVRSSKIGALYRRFVNSIALAKPVDARSMDSGNYIVFLNGVYDCRRGGGFAPGPNKEIMSTRICWVNYNPDPPVSDLFESWKENISPDDIFFFQTFTGYAVSGIGNEKIFLVVTGSGDTGKSSTSTGLYAVFGALGDGDGYITAADLDSFAKPHFRNPGAARPDLMVLKESRLIIVPETETTQVSSALLKGIVSGGVDVTAARDLHRGTSSKAGTASVMFFGNQVPEFDVLDEALQQRYYHMELNSLKKDDIDEEFNYKINNDDLFKENLAFWVMQGLQNYYNHPGGFRNRGNGIIPVAGTNARIKRAAQSHPLHYWWDEYVSYFEGAESHRQIMYESYIEYRVKGGEQRVPPHRFYAMLDQYLELLDSPLPVKGYVPNWIPNTDLNRLEQVRISGQGNWSRN